MLIADGYSLIIRNSSIMNSFEGGFESFMSALPNRTFCSDGQISRIGYMVYLDLKKHAEFLMEKGLRPGTDFLSFHMLTGPITQADWLKYSRYQCFNDSDKVFTVCWLSEDYGGSPVDEQVLAFPEGFSPEKSLNAEDVINPDEINKRFELLSKKDGLYVFWDKLQNREVFVGRTE